MTAAGQGLWETLLGEMGYNLQSCRRERGRERSGRREGNMQKRRTWRGKREEKEMKEKKETKEDQS